MSNDKLRDLLREGKKNTPKQAEESKSVEKIDRSSKATDIKAYETRLSQITDQDYKKANIHPSITETVEFCIVIPSYNNEKYVAQNLNSVFIQNYHNWKIAYIDDASTDRTLSLVNEIAKKAKFSSSKFTTTLSHKTKIQSTAYSFHEAANKFCQNETVMVQLDGDDMLASPDVLNNLAKIYSAGKTWVTFGSFIDTTGAMRIDANKYNIPKYISTVREHLWLASHLRTSYTWFFKQINVNDLKYGKEFIHSANDLAMMIPILEMAGIAKSTYVSDISCIYRIHPNNVHANGRQKQLDMEKHIRSLPKYPLLESKPQPEAIVNNKESCESTATNSAKPIQKSPISSLLTETKLPDQVYVINMDKATGRWTDISIRLDKAGIQYSRFAATNGNTTQITDSKGNSFFGKDILETRCTKKLRLEKGENYKITCNPDDPNSISFPFKGYLHTSGKLISAPEIGRWCSELSIIKHAKDNGYKIIMILEDDIVPFENFKLNLQNTISHMPPNAGIVFLGYTLAGGVKPPVPINQYINGFDSKASGWGTFAYLLTSDAINKLSPDNKNPLPYTYPIDNFYWCISTGVTKIKDHPASECNPYINLIGIHASTEKSLDVLRLNDETAMINNGRSIHGTHDELC